MDSPYGYTVEAAGRPGTWRTARTYADIEEAVVRSDTSRKATADYEDASGASVAQSAAGAARKHMRSEDQGSRS